MSLIYSAFFLNLARKCPLIAISPFCHWAASYVEDINLSVYLRYGGASRMTTSMIVLYASGGLIFWTALLDQQL